MRQQYAKWHCAREKWEIIFIHIEGAWVGVTIPVHCNGKGTSTKFNDSRICSGHCQDLGAQDEEQFILQVLCELFFNNWRLTYVPGFISRTSCISSSRLFRISFLTFHGCLLWQISTFSRWLSISGMYDYNVFWEHDSKI